MKVAIIQNYVGLGEVERNKEIYIDEIRNIVSKSPDFIILPEMWLTGFDYKNLSNYAKEIGNIIKEIQEILPKGVSVISSLPEPSQTKVFNTIFVFNHEKIITQYRKIFLFSPLNEDKFFDKGKDITVFENKGVKAALHTCYEIRFPELFRISAYNGAEIYFIPAIWPADKKHHWLTLLKARAIENQAFVVGCNAHKISTKKKEIDCGYSVIFDPWGETVFQAEQEPVTQIIELNLSKIEEVRTTIPSLKDAREVFTINKKP